MSCVVERSATVAIDTADVPVTALTPGEARHLAALERRIEKGVAIFHEVGQALLDIRDQRLYRQSHETFEAYLRDRWDMARDRAYQLMGAAEVVNVVPEGPVNEAQARELVPVMHNQGPEVATEVWREAKAIAQEAGRPVTAQTVRQVAKQRLAPANTPAEPTQGERLVMQVTNLVNAYSRWVNTKPSRREKAIVTAAFERLREVTAA
jgi:hypothetical protein